MEVINQLGSWSSILGLILTICLSIFGFFIERKVTSIQRQIVFDKRIRPLLKELEQSKKKYPNYINDYEESVINIKYEISQTKVILSNMRNKVDGETKREIDDVLKQIKSIKSANHSINKQRGIIKKILFLFYKKNEINKNDIWQFYSDLSAVQTSIEMLIKDKKGQKYG